MKKKGFTLIELLAVIVILAIIALIATPIVLNIIEKARKGATKASATSYVKAVETYAMTTELDKTLTKLTVGSNDVVTLNGLIEIKGTKPTSGTVTVDKSWKVTEATLSYEGYSVAYDGKDYIVTKGGESSSSGSNEPSTPVVPTIASCPDCVYTYTTTVLNYTGANQTAMTDASAYKTNYNDVVTSSGKNYFLGMKLNATTKNIEKAYACGILNGEAFCIEGSSDDSTFSDNKTLLQSASLYNGACTDRSKGADSVWGCDGTIRAYILKIAAGNAVSAYVGTQDSNSNNCYVSATSLSCK